MVGQAPKGLEDDEGPDPLVGVVGDLARHQPALAAGEGLGDEVLHVTVQVLRPGRRVIQGMGPGNALQKPLDELHGAVQGEGIGRQMGTEVPDLADGRLEALRNW